MNMVRNWRERGVSHPRRRWGISSIRYLSADGLIVKHPTHPKALELIQEAKTSLPAISIESKVGQAYTDALVATQGRQDRADLVFASQGPETKQDIGTRCPTTMKHLDLKSLENVRIITRQLLTII